MSFKATGLRALQCGAGLVIEGGGKAVLDGAVFAGNAGPDIESDGPITVTDSELIERPSEAQLEMISRSDYRAGSASRVSSGAAAQNSNSRPKKYFSGWRPPADNPED